MFGILYSLLVGGAYVAKGIRDTIENEQYRQQYRDDEDGTYYDRNMHLHDQKTGRIVIRSRDTKTGHLMLIDCETCKPIRDLTEIQNRKNMEEAERHYQQERKKFLEGKTNKTYTKYGDDEHKKDKCVGVRYKDLDTGKLYVGRIIYARDEYQFGVLMDPETGKYIRPTDRAIFYHVHKGGIREELFEIIEEKNCYKENRSKTQLPSRFDVYSNYACHDTWEFDELDDEQSVYPLKEKEIQNMEKVKEKKMKEERNKKIWEDNMKFLEEMREQVKQQRGF